MRDPRENPFITLGVSSDAEMSEIQSVGKRRLMMLRLDDDADPAIARRIDAALDTLADPVERFEWGLLAPELTAEEAEAFRNDSVLSTFADDPMQDAMAAYERVSEADSPATYSHNMGALKFVEAVAATEEAQKGTPDDISDDLECIALWQIAYRHLRLAFGSDKFWMRQRLRAKGLEDQRLDADRVKRIQSEIFTEIVNPVGTVIRDALLDRHGEVAKAYVELLRSSSFEDHFVEEVLSAVYAPLADRVERVVTDLGVRLGDAGEDAAEFVSILRAFKRDAEPDLKVMIDVGDLPGYAEEHARDTAAAFLRRLSVVAWNKSEAIDVSKIAIQLASRIVDSEADRRKYKKDVEKFLELEGQKKRRDKLRPLWARLDSAIERDNLPVALSVLDEMLRLGGDDDGSLATLRRRLSTQLATQLFTDGMTAFERADLETALRLMEKALVVETVPSERILIEKALANIRAAKERATSKTRTASNPPPPSRGRVPGRDAPRNAPSPPPPRKARGTGAPGSADAAKSQTRPRRKRAIWHLLFFSVAALFLVASILGQQSRRRAYVDDVARSASKFERDLEGGGYKGIVLPEFLPENGGLSIQATTRNDIERCRELVSAHNSKILDSDIDFKDVPAVISTTAADLTEIFLLEMGAAESPLGVAGKLAASSERRYRKAGIDVAELVFLDGIIVEIKRTNGREATGFIVETLSEELARLEMVLLEYEN